MKAKIRLSKTKKKTLDQKVFTFWHKTVVLPKNKKKKR